MIPEHRRTLSIRGIMGTGKTVMASLLSNEISLREQKPVNVYLIKRKIPSTIPFYEKNCSHFKAKFGINYSSLRPDKVYVVEDAPAFMRTKKRKEPVISLVTVYARQENMFVIITTQRLQQLPTALTVELDLRGEHYFYRVTEGRNATDWIDWTNSKDTSKIIDAIYNGVKGKKKGRRGHAGWKNPNSMRQKVFKMLDEGRNITEIANMYPEKKDVIYVYHVRWKRTRKKLE